MFLSIPSLVLAMAIASVLGRSLENLSLALVFVSWPIYCRLMRGQVLSEKEKPYVSGLKGGYWGPVRDRCRPMTTDHNQWHTGYQVGFRCCEDVPSTPPTEPTVAAPPGT